MIRKCRFFSEFLSYFKRYLFTFRKLSHSCIFSRPNAQNTSIFRYNGGERMQYINAFWVGGLLCVIAQILIDKTKLTPARILVAYVTIGVLLTAIGLYDPLINFAGAGASVPLTGFGYALAKGIEEAVAQNGLLGAFTGGLTACSAGIAAAIFFGLLSSLIRKTFSR